MSSSPSPAFSYWCYTCNRFVSVGDRTAVACPDCGGGFLEEVETLPRPPTPTPSSPPLQTRRRHRLPAATTVMWVEAPTSHPRRTNGDRSPFNPVIVLRNPHRRDAVGPRSHGAFELYYEDGAGTGLRPIPTSMSEVLMGSGFDRLLDQIVQVEAAAAAASCPRASKAAVDSMPTVQIASAHVDADVRCAVCMDAFELSDEAREMPCKHIYHESCILPWLSTRNSCPVCRHEMPCEAAGERRDGEDGGGTLGLAIWRLPGGGFAVGRFAGEQRERELPVVFTEVDGGLAIGGGSGGTPRRVSWNSGTHREGGRRGITQAFRSFLSFFRRSRDVREAPSGPQIQRARSASIFGRGRRTRSRQRSFLDGEVGRIAAGISRW